MVLIFIFAICFLYYLLKALSQPSANEYDRNMAKGEILRQAYNKLAHEQGFDYNSSTLLSLDTENSEAEPSALPSEINVKIKDNCIDTSRIKEYQGQNIPRFEFRPLVWSQFIAQEEAKKQAQTIIKKVKRGIRGHFILGGLKGCGKTTFVELFAHDLKAKLLSYIGRQVNEDNLPDIINAINSSTEENVVLFIDEVDTADWKVLKILNPVIEQFKINGKAIKPFIFASASISRHLLVKNNPDLLDRIPHSINFVRYTIEDLSTILNQYTQQLYKKDNITNEAIYTIANNCKFTPRIAISLLEDFVVEQDIQKVLSNRSIMLEGLDKIDIAVLQRLSECKRAVGSNSLALQIGLNEHQYLREVEPYLLEFGYIQRVPSRIITGKGLDILRQVKKESGK
jgi:Holliday junction resolvasome RuvABC ATP-dependent DNA helicase subunit